jgi:predicted permease
MKEFFRRLHYLLNRRRLERELAEDMEVHREMAVLEGRQNFGNTLLLREEAREAWGWTWIDRFVQDLRYAFRMLAKSPGFTLAAVLTLAIGIGVNVAAFGFFNLMVLRPLPVRDPSTLLRFHRRSAENYAFALPYPEMAFFRQYSRTLSAVLALNDSKLSMEGIEKPLNVHFVTANFFRELGASAEAGRLIDPVRDEAADAEPVVVLSHSFWLRHFGAGERAIGSTIRLNGKLATVIGVASTDFSGLSLNVPDLWMPITLQPVFATGSQLLTDFSVEGAGVQMWGRLRPGLTPQLAEQELRSLAVELRKQHPDDIWEKENLPSEPGGFAKSLLIGNRRGTGAENSSQLYPVVGILSALCLLILAVACGNLGSLLLARGVAREREIAIRVSVGAGRARLVRQLFTESLVLAWMGSMAGLGLSYVVLRTLMVMTDTPAWLDPMPDWPVVVFAIGMGVLAAVLFGLTPALQIARQRHRSTTLRQVLVGAQIAASCVLLIVAGLLVRALNHAVSESPGFEYEHVVSIDSDLAIHGYSPAQARTYLEAFQTRLASIAGVESVSLVDTPPLGNASVEVGLSIDGRNVAMQMIHIDPSFFQTMRIPLLRGHNFARGDKHIAVISESLARRAWPGQEALGKQLPIDGGCTVIGIVGSARLVKPEDSDSVEVYLPTDPARLASMVVLVRTTAPPNNLAAPAAAIAKSLDREVFPEIRLLRSSFQQKLHATQYSAYTAGLLGFTALLLACLGVAGVVSYAVSQRTKEIGIRMTLGAKPMQVLSIVLRQFSTPVVAGSVVGIGGAAALAQLLRGSLYGVSHLDPAAYLSAMLVFAITVLLSAWIPARRALRIDPMQALRIE